MPVSHRIVAAVILRGGQVLLCHRGPGRWYADTWDLPGGHIESGETPAAALVRELREELGVEVAAIRDDPDVRVTTDDFDLFVWLVIAWSGDPTNAAPDEHDEVAWFDIAAIRRLRMADSRYPTLIEDLLSAARRDERSQV